MSAKENRDRKTHVRPAGSTASVRRASSAAPKGTAAAGAPKADEPLPERTARRCAYGVVAAMVVFTVVLSVLSMQKYRAYEDGRYDTGIMVQTVFNTAHGHFLESTDAQGKQISRLGAHVDPIIAVFAIPWLVWPSADMLFVFQALIVALSAWPAFRLGTRVLGDPRAGFCVACALLLYPPLQYSVLNEFHPVTLAIPLLLFSFTYLEEDRRWAAVPFLVLAALCKEEIPLVIAVMGAYFALRKRSLWPLAITALATAWFVVAMGVVIPHYNAGGTPFVDRYADYGSNTGEVARNVFLRPDKTAADLFSGSNLAYWGRLLWPFLFLPLLSPLTTLIAAPELALNALASRIFHRSIEFHYVAGEVPFLFAGAVLGLARLWRWLERRSKAGGDGRGARRKARERPPLAQRLPVTTLAGLVLAASVAGNYFMGPLPFSLPGAEKSGKDYRVPAHARALNKGVAVIPGDPKVKVSAGNIPGSHLSEREVIYVWPYVDAADWVIVDQTRPFWFGDEDKVRHDQALGLLVMNTDYLNVFAEDGVFVFKRVSGTAPPPGAPGASPSPQPSLEAPPPLPTAAPTAGP